VKIENKKFLSMAKSMNVKMCPFLTFKIYNFYLRKREEKGKELHEVNLSPVKKRSKSTSNHKNSTTLDQ
jgi:hypothetical protein